tara:strand:+ start:232 stop:378 length:147 start_codon:yes stop_codon:yes gene_type:complete
MKKENVKLLSAVVDKVREQKKVTRIPIGAFIEMAIEEKLSKLSSKNKK